MEGKEELEGGIVSPNLVRGWPRGYALYTTNKRVVGVKRPKVGIAGLFVSGRVNPVGGLVTERLPDDTNTKLIQELDERKDFELVWDDIKQVELKKPGTLIGGHVTFSAVSGEQITVKIGTKKDFEIIATLLRRFMREDRLSGLNT